MAFLPYPITATRSAGCFAAIFTYGKMYGNWLAIFSPLAEKVRKPLKILALQNSQLPYILPDLRCFKRQKMQQSSHFTAFCSIWHCVWHAFKGNTTADCQANH